MGAAQNLSKNLISLRALHQSSLVNFAEKLQISKSTLQEIEHGHPPRLDTVECIAQHLDIPVAVLLSDAGTPGQTQPLLHFLHSLQWYAAWPQEDRDELLHLVCQIAALLTKNSE